MIAQNTATVDSLVKIVAFICLLLVIEEIHHDMI